MNKIERGNIDPEKHVVVDRSFYETYHTMLNFIKSQYAKGNIPKKESSEIIIHADIVVKRT